MEPRPFTVEKVHGWKEVQLTHGKFTQFDLDLSGVGPCQWLSKQTEPPKVGEELIGIIDGSNPDFPPKFKKAAPQQSFNGAPQEDTRQKMIVRQHSQEMALRYAEVQGLRGKLPDDFQLDQLRPIIDWFERDAGSS